MVASSRVAKAECPSCHKNSLVLRNGCGCLNSQRTTLHHWFKRSGKSRCDCTQRAYDGYMTVSLVGRMAMGSASSLCPDFVTHATCGFKKRITIVRKLEEDVWYYLKRFSTSINVFISNLKFVYCFSKYFFVDRTLLILTTFNIFIVFINLYLIFCRWFLTWLLMTVTVQPKRRKIHRKNIKLLKFIFRIWQ